MLISLSTLTTELLEKVIDFIFDKLMSFQMIDLILGVLLALGYQSGLLLSITFNIPPTLLSILFPITNPALHSAIWFLAGFYTRSMYNVFSISIEIMSSFLKTFDLFVDALLFFKCIRIPFLQTIINLFGAMLSIILTILNTAMVITSLGTYIASPFLAYTFFQTLVVTILPDACITNSVLNFFVPESLAKAIVFLLLILAVLFKVILNSIRWTTGTARIPNDEKFSFNFLTFASAGIFGFFFNNSFMIYNKTVQTSYGTFSSTQVFLFYASIAMAVNLLGNLFLYFRDLRDARKFYAENQDAYPADKKKKDKKTMIIFAVSTAVCFFAFFVPAFVALYRM